MSDEPAPEDITEKIIQFLVGIGIDVDEVDTLPGSLLPGVTMASGSLLVARSELAWPGDLLHEAGHLAVLPASERARIGSDASDSGIPFSGEAEATAWAWAATLYLALPADVLFHEGGYYGKSARLAFTYQAGSYPGAAGLIANGMAASREQATNHGLLPYPHMLHWLRA